MNALESLIINWSFLGATLEAQLMYVWIQITWNKTFSIVSMCVLMHLSKDSRYCRKVIVLDHCFFKGAVKSELLCAISRDANSQMYALLLSKKPM
jgi:hypothetical protein